MTRRVWLLAAAILALAWIVPTTSGYAERVLGTAVIAPPAHVRDRAANGPNTPSIAVPRTAKSKK
jgi:hypothetical protein